VLRVRVRVGAVHGLQTTVLASTHEPFESLQAASCAQLKARRASPRTVLLLLGGAGPKVAAWATRAQATAAAAAALADTIVVLGAAPVPAGRRWRWLRWRWLRWR